MKRPVAAVLLLLPLLLLTACESAPTPEELKSAHYGHYPSNYRSATRKVLENRHEALGDPFEVVSISTPQKDYSGGAGNRTWGYSSEAVYNAPNPTVGASIYHYREKVLFHNGEVVEVKNETNVGDVMLSAVANNLAAATASDQGDAGDGSDDGGGGDDGTGATGRNGSRRSGGRQTAVRTNHTTALRTNRTTTTRTNHTGTTVTPQKKAPAVKTAPVIKKKS